jgi:hypothetical protein
MRSGIIGRSDIEIICFTIINRDVNVADLNEHLEDVSKELNCRSNFKFRLISFHSGGNHGDIKSLSADSVTMADHGDVDVIFPVELFLRNNDLNTRSVICVRNRVVKNANGSDNLHSFLDFLVLHDIRGIADNKRSFGNLIIGLDSSDFSIFTKENLVNVGVEHVSTSMDSAKSRETFRKTSQTIDRIEERRITILSKGFDVKLDLLDSFDGRLGEVLIISEESDCMSQEINGIIFKFMLLENIRHGLLVKVNILPG